MIKLYLMIIVLAVLGAVGAGAFWYYKDTQARMATLRENNAKLEVAIQTSEESINNLQQTMETFSKANEQLQNELQKAEQYGDELQAKLRRHDLTALALKKPKQLEGKMNDATAKLWRDIERDTGGSGDAPLPQWLQQSESSGVQRDSREGSADGDQNRASADTNSSKTETSTTQ